MRNMTFDRMGLHPGKGGQAGISGQAAKPPRAFEVSLAQAPGGMFPASPVVHRGGGLIKIHGHEELGV